MNIVLARIELSEEVKAAAKALSEAVRKPSAAGMAKGHQTLLSLADPCVRCTIPWKDWESVIARARTSKPDLVPDFLIYGHDISLLRSSGLPESAVPVFSSAEESGAAVLQCFPEDEE